MSAECVHATVACGTLWRTKQCGLSSIRVYVYTARSSRIYFGYVSSSAEQSSERQNTTARKRRRNQNVEIDELGDLLPFKPDNGKSLDKLSILRLTTSFMRFQNFMSSGKMFMWSQVMRSSLETQTYCL